MNSADKGVDIIKIKQAVKAGQLKVYVKDGKIYLQDDIGEVVEVGKLDPDAEALDKIRAEINSPNRGTCDYFIVDRIEEIIDKYKAESEMQDD